MKKRNEMPCWEAADAIGITEEELKDLAARGILSMRREEREHYFRVDEIERYIDADIDDERRRATGHDEEGNPRVITRKPA